MLVAEHLVLEIAFLWSKTVLAGHCPPHLREHSMLCMLFSLPWDGEGVKDGSKGGDKELPS